MQEGRFIFCTLGFHDILFIVFFKKFIIIIVLISISIYLLGIEVLAKQGDYVPGEVVIKLKENAKKGIIKLSTGKLQVRRLPKLKEITQKYGLLEIDELIKNTGITVQSVKRKYLKRQSRAPKGVKSVDFSLFYHLKFPQAIDLEALLKELNAVDGIEYAEPNYYYYKFYTPNDTYYNEENTLEKGYKDQWALYRMNISKGWDTVQSGKTAVVAVVDTGIDYNHDELKNVVWTNSGETPNNGIDDDGNGYVDDYYGYDFGDNDGDPSDIDGHGSHVSGVIAAETNNNDGIASVAAFRCQIMGIKVFADGASDTTLVRLSKAISFAITNGADVINFSLGGTYSKTFTSSVENAVSNGIAVVAAAGNGGSDNIGDNLDVYPLSPVCNDGTSTQNYIIGVSAIIRDDTLADFSNYGSYIDLAAPGYDILSVRGTGTNMNSDVGTIYSKDSRFIRASGTSQACPLVSGVVASMISSNPNLTYDEIKTILFDSATDLGTSGRDTYYGYGLIEAFKSIGKSDTSPPTINHAAVAKGDIGNVITMNTFIVDNVNSSVTGNIIPSANLYYLSYKGSVPSGSYTAVVMTKDGINYTGDIPPQSSDVSSIRYYFEAYDANPDNTVKLPTNAPTAYYNMVLQDLSGPTIAFEDEAGDYVSTDGTFVVDMSDNVTVSTNSIAVGIIKGTSVTTYNIVTNPSIVSYANGKVSIDLSSLNLDAGSYTIRVYGVDTSGNSSTASLSVNLSDTTTTLELFGPEGTGTPPLNYPNPFNPLSESTRIAFQITKSVTSIDINIYTISGELVRSLTGSNAAGYQTVEWDGKDEMGSVVPNGVYLYRIVVDSGSDSLLSKGKIAVIK